MGHEADLQRSHGLEVLDNDQAYRPFRVTPESPAVYAADIRVGVSGTLGCGITTTARGLAQRLELPFLTEVARTTFEHGFKFGNEGSIRGQCAMYFSQMFLENSTPSYVSDRTVIDAVAHAEVLADMTGDREDRLVAIAMGNAAAAAVKDFTALFYTPIEFALTFDGVRVGDIEFQKNLDRKFRDLIDRLQLPYVVVHGSVEERLDQACAVIERELAEKAAPPTV